MKVKINLIKPNEENPRIIKDYKFNQLVKSIKEFPQMMDIRPIVVNKDMVVLGGNMRLKACQEAGLKEVKIIKADNLTPEQEKEFIIKDNVGFGIWDWDTLANEWDNEKLKEWGMDVWSNYEDVGEFFTDPATAEPEEEKEKLCFDLSIEDKIKVEKYLKNINKNINDALCQIISE